VKAGDLVAWKNNQFGKESTYLVIRPDPARSESYQTECWQALSCRGALVIVHEDAMEVISEAG
jgi:hypothetical protein